MGKPTGFLEHPRRESPKEPKAERLRTFREFERSLPIVQAREQGARCMSCGVPFCHTGCPLGNAIPDWNTLVYEDRWQEALAALHSTNNFPEITGRICPAPCEAACVAALHDEPVAIRAIERAIADRGLAEAWVASRPRQCRTARSVAVVGSGPAGLACAQQLSRAGHAVTVLERDDRLGGLLRYGIPDFKLDKSVIDARLEQMRAEGVAFTTGVNVGVDVTIGELRSGHDAVVLATGARRPRDLAIEGRELDGVCFAMEFLVQQNRVVAGDVVGNQILATGKRVVILGGGDTGSDCLGTALRQRAASVVQIELMPRPPDERAPETPWPLWPMMMRTSSSQEEGGSREFGVLTKRLLGEEGHVRALEAVRVEWLTGVDGRRSFREIEGSSFRIEADLVLLAMGFAGAETQPVAFDEWGRVRAAPGSFATSVERVFACGDARRGQSLVVWAIWEGREAARAIDAYLRAVPLVKAKLPTSPYRWAP